MTDGKIGQEGNSSCQNETKGLLHSLGMYCKVMSSCHAGSWRGSQTLARPRQHYWLIYLPSSNPLLSYYVLSWDLGEDNETSGSGTIKRGGIDLSNPQILHLAALVLISIRHSILNFRGTLPQEHLLDLDHNSLTCRIEDFTSRGAKSFKTGTKVAIIRISRGLVVYC